LQAVQKVSAPLPQFIVAPAVGPQLLQPASSILVIVVNITSTNWLHLGLSCGCCVASGPSNWQWKEHNLWICRALISCNTCQARGLLLFRFPINRTEFFDAL